MIYDKLFVLIGNKNFKMSLNVKNLLLFIVEKVVLFGFGFINNILLVWLVGFDLFGEFFYVVLFVIIFSFFVVMGLNNIIIKYIVKYFVNSYYYIKLVLFICLLGVIILLCIVILVCLFVFNLDYY